MTLLQLTEPLFQYVCRLNRFARRGAGPKATGDTVFLTRGGAKTEPSTITRGANLEYDVARSEIKAIFEDMMAKASTEIRLSQQARKVELPLIFFVDAMISESSLPFAMEWNNNRLAYDR